MTNPTILIAGATGTNGSELIKQLVARNIPVRAMVRDLERSKSLQGDLVQLVEADLSDPDSLQRAFDGIEKAYIVTAVAQGTPEWFSNFYSAAKKAGVKHLVKFSGMRATADSPSEVIRQHAVSDQALIDSGLTYTIIRPNSFHQNMLWQAGPIKDGRQFYLPLADARQSTVDVRDLAEATANILTQPGHDNKIYELSGPESISFKDVADILSEVVGDPVTYVPVPVEAAEQAMLDAGMPQWNAHALAEIQGLFATGKYADVTDDLRQLLGREPRTFRQFAEDFAPAFR